LLELFQKLAGFEGAAPLIDLRRGRNSLDFEKVPLFGKSFGVPWRIHRRWILERGVDIV
jgi:hypothetical protein